MNNLRKQIDNNRKIDNVNTYDNRLPALTGDLRYNKAADQPQRQQNVEDVEAEEINENESLNLNDIGRITVEKALERNGGNRKKAAQELGISDRTLYRRIKQYGLDK